LQTASCKQAEFWADVCTGRRKPTRFSGTSGEAELSNRWAIDRGRHASIGIRVTEKYFPPGISETKNVGVCSDDGWARRIAASNPTATLGEFRAGGSRRAKVNGEKPLTGPPPVFVSVANSQLQNSCFNNFCKCGKERTAISILSVEQGKLKFASKRIDISKRAWR